MSRPTIQDEKNLLLLTCVIDIAPPVPESRASSFIGMVYICQYMQWLRGVNDGFDYEFDISEKNLKCSRIEEHFEILQNKEFLARMSGSKNKTVSLTLKGKSESNSYREQSADENEAVFTIIDQMRIRYASEGAIYMNSVVKRIMEEERELNAQ